MRLFAMLPLVAVVRLCASTAHAESNPEPTEPKHDVSKHEEESLYEAELSFGYGIAMGGGGGAASMRATPLAIGVSGSIAISEEPHLAAYGGAILEVLERNAIGAVAGVRFSRGPIRLGAGGTWIFAPETLWGAVGSVGVCHKLGIRLCADLEITAYFAGTDLAEGRTVTHVAGVLAMVFDVL